MKKWTKFILTIVIVYGVIFLLRFSIGFIVLYNGLKEIDETCVPGQQFSLIKSGTESFLGIDLQKEKYERCMEFKKVEAYQYSIKYNSSEDCKNAPKKLLCSVIVASKTRNMADCNNYDYCIYRLAMMQSNSSMCQAISSTSGADYCYYKFAIFRRDSKLCEMIHSAGGYDCKTHCKDIIDQVGKTTMPINIVDTSDTCNKLAESLGNNEVYV